MRILILTTAIALLILTLILGCSRQTNPPPAKDQFVNLITSQPGSVTLSAGDKYRLAKYVLGQLQSLTNSTPRKP